MSDAFVMIMVYYMCLVITVCFCQIDSQHSQILRVSQEILRNQPKLEITTE